MGIAITILVILLSSRALTITQSPTEIGMITTAMGEISVVPAGWQDATFEPSELEVVPYIYKGQVMQVKLPKDNQGGAAASFFLPPYGLATGTDADKDGIVDRMEDTLAEQFAPVIIHDKADLNFPASVDWILKRASLEYYNNNGLFNRDDHQSIGGPALTQGDLLGHIRTGRGGSPIVHSDGTRSKNRRHTFAILDLGRTDRQGSLDSRDWRTYVHVFRNYSGGVTIQYWRSYAYNTGDQAVSLPVEIDHHGGDWEAVEVVLSKEIKPLSFAFLGHTGIERRTPSEVQLESTHVRVYSEPGGHASRSRCNPNETGTISGISYRIWVNDLNDSSNIIRQETWSSGTTVWPSESWRSHIGGIKTESGGLLNVGEKMNSLNGQVFIRYSGLWGSLGANFSGYWGPAFNETQMGPDGFITAWAYGMKASKGNVISLHAECYPADTSD